MAKVARGRVIKVGNSIESRDVKGVSKELFLFDIGEEVVVISRARHDKLCELEEAIQAIGATGDALVCVKSQYERYRLFYERFHKYCESMERELFGGEEAR